MVNLPVVTKQQFERHVAETQKMTEKSDVNQTYYCSTCNKKFSNAATLKQHRSTKKHLQNEANKAMDIEINEQ